MPSKCQFEWKPFHSYFCLIIIIISVQCLLYSPVASVILFETRYYFKWMRLKCALDASRKDEIIYLNHSCQSRWELFCEPDLIFLQQPVLSDRELKTITQRAVHRNKFPIQMIHLALGFDWIENAGRIAKQTQWFNEVPDPCAFLVAHKKINACCCWSHMETNGANEGREEIEFGFGSARFSRAINFSKSSFYIRFA